MIELKEPSEHKPSPQLSQFRLGRFAVNRLGYGAMRLAGPGVFGPPFGRGRECEVLDRLLGAGRGGVLVVHGEAGVGKTALIEYAVAAGRKFRVARTIGIEADMELPFAAAQQSCAPLLNLSDHLPQHQHEAFSVAFGVSAGPAPSPYLVRLALLGLSEAAEQRPLLAVVDDAYWLDQGSARALSFVARRLLAEQIALMFVTRQIEDPLTGLPELRISPLGHRDARALLESQGASAPNTVLGFSIVVALGVTVAGWALLRRRQSPETTTDQPRS